MSTVFIYIAYFLSSVGGAVLFKLKSGSIKVLLSAEDFSLTIGWVSILGLMLYVFSFLLWMVILKSQQISVASPIILGISNILLITSGFFIFNEKISAVNITGIALVLIGVYLISIKN